MIELRRRRKGREWSVKALGTDRFGKEEKKLLKI
jgi:hypothetical protein